MNKEQLEALIRDGRISAACVMFADHFKIPASDVAEFVGRVLIACEPTASQLRQLAKADEPGAKQ